LGRLGVAVQAARRRLGLTQEVLAARLPRQTVARVEANSFPEFRDTQA
jgi:transcriptional regulator with XRE-family HTH domain